MNTQATNELLQRLHSAVDGYWAHDRQIEPGLVNEAALEIERLRKIEKEAQKVVSILDRTEMSFALYKPLAELLP